MSRNISSKISLAVVLGLFAVTAAYADITVKVLPSLAPNVFGSPSWAGYAANAVYAIQNDLTSWGDPNSPTYYNQTDTFSADQTIVTGFSSWMGQADPTGAFALELGNRMHFGFDIVATGETFNADSVSFNSTSSPGLGLDYSWAAGPWSYSAVRIGIVHNADGTIKTIYNSGLGSQLVDEMIYVGSGNSYDALCVGCTTEQKQAAITAAASGGGGYTYTGTYSVTGSSNSIYSGTADFVVDSVPEPSAILLFGTFISIVAVVGRRRRLKQR